MNLKEIDYEDLEWTYVAQDRDQWWGSVKNCSGPSDSI
jgi:hypothetical protein